MQFQGFAQVPPRFFFALSLARDINVEALCDIPFAFTPDTPSKPLLHTALLRVTPYTVSAFSVGISGCRTGIVEASLWLAVMQYTQAGRLPLRLSTSIHVSATVFPPAAIVKGSPEFHITLRFALHS